MSIERIRARRALVLGRAAGDLVLELLYPSVCASCGAHAAGVVCARCVSEIVPDREPFCPRCLAARDDPFGCRAHASRGAVWGVHGGTLRRLVHALKYDARRAAAKELARGIGGTPAAARLLEETEIVTPVPSESGRLRARGYHPAAWLAQALGSEAGRPVVLDLLVRLRGGPSQTRLDPGARWANVEGAFAASRANLAAGRRVLLVDDVVTTGATARACFAALEQAGAAAVALVAAARAFDKSNGREGLSYLADR